MINDPNTWPLDKTRKVAELNRAELDALVASVKIILQSDTTPAGVLLRRIKQIYQDDISFNGPLNDRHYFVAKRIVQLLQPNPLKAPSTQEVPLTPRMLGILMPPTV